MFSPSKRSFSGELIVLRPTGEAGSASAVPSWPAAGAGAFGAGSGHRHRLAPEDGMY